MEIKQLFSQHKTNFLKYLFGAFLSTPTNIMMTFAIANTFNVLEAQNTNEILMTVLLTAILSLSPIFMQMISRFLRIGFMRDILLEVRLLAYDKFLKTPVHIFKDEVSDTHMSHLTSDINLFEQEFFLSLLNIIVSGGSFIIGIIVMFFISYQIALITIITTLILFLVTQAFTKVIEEKKAEQVIENSNFVVVLSNILNGLETIKLYQVSANFFKRFKMDVNKLENTKRSANTMDLIFDNVIVFISGTYQTAAVLLAVYLFSINKIMLSSVIMIFNLSGQLIWALNNTFSFINRFKSSLKIYVKLTTANKVPTSKNEFNFIDKIDILNLGYSYADSRVFKDLDFSINKNDKILVYGESGSGKTTFINNLCKNLIDYEGQILIDKVELNSIDYESFNKEVGYVRQEHFIFDDSIINNIILNKAYDQNKFIEVLKSVNLLEFVNNQIDKEHHFLIDNGSNISGGQRARINIARELYQDKSMIIFDEPSASLDDYNAVNIYDNILSLNKTIIIVSHRHLDYLKDRTTKALEFKREVAYE